jgi:hypothetical protein
MSPAKHEYHNRIFQGKDTKLGDQEIPGTRLLNGFPHLFWKTYSCLIRASFIQADSLIFLVSLQILFTDNKPLLHIILNKSGPLCTFRLIQLGVAAHIKIQASVI